VEFANDVAFAPLIAGSKASGGGPTLLGMAAGPQKEKLAAPKRNEPRRLPASSQISLSSREITHVFGPNAGFQPVFLQESFFQNLAAAQRRVDRYAAYNTVSATDLTELMNTSVKTAGGFGPQCYEPAQMTWLQRPPSVASSRIPPLFPEVRQLPAPQWCSLNCLTD
jgi:hypothetical protein